MKVCVVNGSPKGEKSVTMQYVRFLKMAKPQDEYINLHIGQNIKKIETDAGEWNSLLDVIGDADIILWATPVYFLLVPAQLKRFIELVNDRNVGNFFSGKYSASLTTSVHFFDNLAHDYLQGISEDLGMKWIGSFSAATSDLFDPLNQKQLVAFGDDIVLATMEQRPVQKKYLPVRGDNPCYVPTTRPNPVDTKGKQVLILHDASVGSSLENMVLSMAASFQGNVTVAHLDETGMKGGCLGCVQCAFENRCVYTDGYTSFFTSHIPPADIIIYAGAIRDRYLSAQWKQFFDRSFFLGHIPRLTGKQALFLIEGPLSSLPGLRENLTTLASIGGANLVGIVTNEATDPGEIDACIQSAAERAVLYAQTGYMLPGMFPAFGGHKIFRDMIWGDLRPIFQADHRYFRTHNLYDFPQKNYRRRIQNRLFSLFLCIPGVQGRVRSSMRDHMIAGFSRVWNDNPLLDTRRRESKEMKNVSFIHNNRGTWNDGT